MVDNSCKLYHLDLLIVSFSVLLSVEELIHMKTCSHIDTTFKGTRLCESLS